MFDKGQLKDGQGRDIDFKNTMIIMTSNAGTDAIEKLCADPETMPDAAGLVDALRPELLKVFKPAFLGRVTVVAYFPLAPEIIREIVKINLKRVEERLERNYGASFSWSDAVVDAIAARCTETQSGARNIENIMNQTIIPELASRILGELSTGKTVRGAALDMDSSGQFNYQLSLSADVGGEAPSSKRDAQSLAV